MGIIYRHHRITDKTKHLSLALLVGRAGLIVVLVHLVT